MSVAPIGLNEWRGPGCGADCEPKRHDPHAHEVYGLLMALWTPPARVVRTGALVVDLATQNVSVDGAPVHLTPRERAILIYLAERIGTACPSNDIVAAVWGPAWVDPGAVYIRPDGYPVTSSHQLLNINVHRLRKRLGEAGRLITTRKHACAPARRLELVEPT